MTSTKPYLLKRHAERRVRAALQDTRVVAIVGPRQSGKTTLARHVAQDDYTFLTLDDVQTRDFARDDPTAFVRSLDKAVIDEIQRAPDLLLAIKQAVDEDQRPGRFLITGSADLFAGTVAPDSLAGRVETVELFPLSQAEIQDRPASQLVDRLFEGSLKPRPQEFKTSDLLNRVLAGGYPEALSRKQHARRRSWLRSYAESLSERDVSDIAKLYKPEMMKLLVAHAAAMSGRLLNRSELGSRVGADDKTVDAWLNLLEQVFLIRRVPSWQKNTVRRLIKAPTVHFLDSGLLAALLRIDHAKVQRDRSMLGPLLECFVFSELTKIAAASDVETIISHYRDKDKTEVDFVLERSPGILVGIEVKASATVKTDDFRGLKRLRDANGDLFSQGVILHDGDQIIPYGDRLLAAPISLLWCGS